MSSQPRLLSSPKVTDDAGTTEGFVASVDEHLRSYVYVFVDPRNGQIFHADAATGDGCFRALAEARDQHPVVRAIEAAGGRVRIDILRHGLEPETAAVVAGAVRDALGPSALAARPSTPTTTQRMSVGAINAMYGARPVTILPEHPVVLVRVPRAGRRGTDRHCYELTRGWWLADARREGAKWAFAVSDGVVHAVYHIDGWEPARAGNRWGFRGRRDPAMEQRYLRADVSSYMESDPQAPLTYVNC